jgi:hypothetical protein
MSTDNRATRVRLASDQQFVAALKTHFGSADATFTLDGKPTKVTDILALLQQRIDATNAVTSLKAQYHAAVLTENNLLSSTASTLAAFKSAVLSSVGTSSPTVLADFGLAPKKPPRPLTTEERAAAQAKAKATRAARHTMGPRQKAKVTAAAVAPPSPAPSPSPTAQPTVAPQPTPTPAH